jgi:ubiquitin C-terminal hydrolase
VGGQFGVILNRTSKNGKSTEVVRVPFVMGKDGVNYRLTGAVAHYGNSMNSGHYYSYKIDSDGRWLCYNDNYSNHVNEERMKDDIERNGIMFVYSA